METLTRINELGQAVKAIGSIILHKIAYTIMIPEGLAKIDINSLNEYITDIASENDRPLDNDGIIR